MDIIIDIVGSIVLAGLLILSVNSGVVDLNETTYEQTYTLNSQTNIVALARIIEHDFVKIGFGAPGPAILVADSQAISFQSELYNDGSLKTVTYSVGSITGPKVAPTKNPRDFMLFRELAGEPPLALSSGLVEFNITYFDSAGAVTTSPGDVDAIQIRLRLETEEPVDDEYPGVFWERTIYPKNL